MPPSKKSAKAKINTKSAEGSGDFEKRLKRLEELSSAMKDGEMPLEDALKNFEEGVKLAKGLEKDLSRIERRIEILVNNPEDDDEKPKLELFPELDEE